MMTIKIQAWDAESDYPMHSKTGNRPAKTYRLFEGKNIFHRGFEFKTLKEFEKWYDGCMRDFCMNYQIGGDPRSSLKNAAKSKESDYVCYVDFITFESESGGVHKILVSCSNVYIMNAEGQTVDQF